MYKYSTDRQADLIRAFEKEIRYIPIQCQNCQRDRIPLANGNNCCTYCVAVEDLN